MTRRALLLTALLLCALPTLLCVESARAAALIVKLRAVGPQSADAPDAPDRLQRGPDARSVRALFRRQGGSRFALQRARRESAGAALPDLSHVYRVELGAGVDAAEAAARYRADPNVVWAQPDYPMRLDFVPDDPFFFSSGSWGQPYADLWGLSAIRAPEAWQLTQGEGAVIAVIDTGLDAGHPDIADNLWVNPGEDLNGDGRASDADRNGSDDDGNGLVDDLTGYDFFNDDADPFDDNGHGTHVAGIAAAVGGNGLGILGVAPRARVMALKGFPGAGSGDSSALAEAIVYAAHNGADVMNNSWSCSVRCPTNPVIDEAVLLAHALGTVVVTSAGNSSDDVVFQSPKSRRETIVVASSREDDSIAPSSSHGLLLDLAAPGAGRPAGDPFATEAILSLLSSGAAPELSERTSVGEIYLRLSGTSQAAPHVAGVVALMRSLEPDATPEEIRARLRASARDAGAPGHDPVYGAGIVDAFAALTERAPRVRGEISRPFAGEILRAQDGVISVQGSAGGEDFAGYALAFGRGLEPASWQPIAAAGAGPVESGLLAEWNAAELEDGPYALRLTVTGRSGEQIQEFAPLSLERSQPTPVSPDGVQSFAPDVSGALVVYESERGDTGRDVFAADLRSGRERALSTAAGDQQQARVSGRRIVYRDTGAQPGGEIHTCLMHFGLVRCDDVAVALGPGQRSAPVVSGARVFWTERDASGREPAPVRPLARPALVSRASGGGAPRAPGGARGLREAPGVARALAGVLDLELRAVATRRRVPGAARERLLPVPVRAGVSGETFAWEQFASGRASGSATRVNVCRLEAGPCTPAAGGRAVARAARARRLRRHGGVERRRARARPPRSTSASTIRSRTRCPAQRLTGQRRRRAQPAIDGRRVVFEDERDGPARIYALELPDLLRDRSAAACASGRLLQLAI